MFLRVFFKKREFIQKLKELKDTHPKPMPSLHEVISNHQSARVADGFHDGKAKATGAFAPTFLVESVEDVLTVEGHG